jgi:large subunit ribosomal protein L17
MRHKINQKKLKGSKSQIDKVIRNLAGSVILFEKVETTKSKAKLAKSLVEKTIHPRSLNEVNERRRLMSIFFDKNIVNKIFDLRKYYKDKNSGFLKMVSAGFRKGDGAPKVILLLMLPEKLKKAKAEKVAMAKPKVTVVEKKPEKVTKEPIKPKEKKEGWLDRASKGPLSTFRNMAKKITSRRTTSK